MGARAHLFGLAIAVAGFLSVSPFAHAKENACLAHPAWASFPNKALAAKLMTGFNLPNWDAVDPARRPNFETLASLRKAGLSHVRLPVFMDALMSKENRAGAVYIADLKAMTLRLNALGYAVSVDFHPGSTFNEIYSAKPEEGFTALARIWKRLAKALMDTDPEFVAVELLNEPDQSPEIWNRHAGQLIKTVRESLPNHTIIIGPAGPQRHEVLFGMTPDADPNTIYAVHYYDPFFFTHQGAEWLGADNPLAKLSGAPYPVERNHPVIVKAAKVLEKSGETELAAYLREDRPIIFGRKDIAATMAGISEWSKRWKRPVIINEYGVLSYESPRLSRLTWLKHVTTEAAIRCIGLAHWDYSDGFGFVDPDTDRPDATILSILTAEHGIEP